MDLLARRPLASFFALAYLGSWIVWSPWWLLSRSGLGVLGFDLPPNAFAVINLVGLFCGPFLAALVVTKATEGRGAPFLRRLAGWRTARLSYLIALVAIPAALAAGVVLWPSDGAEATVRGPALFVTLAITFVVFLVGRPSTCSPTYCWWCRCPWCWLGCPTPPAAASCRPSWDTTA